MGPELAALRAAPVAPVGLRGAPHLLAAAIADAIEADVRAVREKLTDHVHEVTVDGFVRF